ncbi:sugar phosphate isomerase/epimerase family protein [Cohnella yongneupensis]|uniref:Sugar phosphate isomerase/epimerase family protein n=1 Tax=Cohnella yongneupensis TaxID=425006 RepID=A0ABW0R7Z4_9BACL
MKLGVLSIAFGQIGHRELARKINHYGFDATHLEMNHITDVDCRPGKLSTGMANHLAEEFARYGVNIPVLGCYVNLIDKDTERRKLNLKQLKEHLRFARDFGASTVTTETGTANVLSPWEHHPDNQNEENWNELRAVVENLAEEAEKWGVFLGLEGYTNNVINTPERMERLLQEVPSSNLGIVMDPCNYIDESNKHRQDDVIRDAIARLGNRILIAHAKDFNYAAKDRADHRNVQPAAGTGELNYPLYMELLMEAKPYMKIYLEHLHESQMLASADYVNKALESGRRTQEVRT